MLHAARCPVHEGFRPVCRGASKLGLVDGRAATVHSQRRCSEPCVFAWSRGARASSSREAATKANEKQQPKGDQKGFVVLERSVFARFSGGSSSSCSGSFRRTARFSPFGSTTTAKGLVIHAVAAQDKYRYAQNGRIADMKSCLAHWSSAMSVAGLS